MTNPPFWLAKLVNALGGACKGKDTHCWTWGAWGTFVAFQPWSTLGGGKQSHFGRWVLHRLGTLPPGRSGQPLLTMGPGRPLSPGKPRKPGGPSFPGRPAGPGSPCNDREKHLRSADSTETQLLPLGSSRNETLRNIMSLLNQPPPSPAARRASRLASGLLLPTLVPSFPVRPGRPCSPGGPGGPGCPRSPIGPVSPVGP